MAQQAQLISGDARTMGMDLRVGYEVMDPDNPDMRTHQFQIKQELTGILTNPLEREKGLLRSRMAALETEKLRRDLRTTARVSLAQWASLGLRRQYLKETKILLDQIKALAQVKFTTGTLDLVDWNRLEGELDETDLERLEIEERFQMLVGEFEKLTPSGAAIRDWAAFQAVTRTDFPPREEFLKKAQSNWPKLNSSESMGEILELERSGAYSGAFPAVMAMAGWRFPEAQPIQGTLTLGIEFSLPTLTLPSRFAMAEEAGWMKKQEAENQAQALLDLKSAYGEYTGRITLQEQMIQKIETGLIPRQLQSIQLLMDAYRVGRAEFSQLLETGISLASLRDDLAQRRLEVAKLYLALETFTGETYLNFETIREDDIK